jgi:hypothetical protein
MCRIGTGILHKLFTYSTDAMKPAKNMAMLPANDFSRLWGASHARIVSQICQQHLKESGLGSGFSPWRDKERDVATSNLFWY